MNAPDPRHAALRDEALELTRRWCAIRSIRGETAGLSTMAGALVDWIGSELGAEILPQGLAASPPIVHARIDAGRPVTVILYNMYDVMPADPRGWSADPFVGDTIDLPGIGPSFVARGAENNKGPLAGMLVAVRALVRNGGLPVNLEIVLEGEEESGSRALRAYLADPSCKLRRADSALFPSLCEYGGGPPRLYLGFSGVAKGTMTVAGGDWGGPRRAIHSSNAPWIANPASRLVEAIARMATPPTGRIGSVKLDEEARAFITALARHFDPAAELAFRDTARYAVPGSACELLSTVLSTTSFNIAWLSTDPPHGDAVIPHSASAGFELRTPPGLDPSAILSALSAKLVESGLAGVDIDVALSSPGYRFAATAPGVAELAAVYAGQARPAQIWPWAIGSAPAQAFAPYSPSLLIGGLGRGGNAHGIDEFMTLDGLERFLQSIIGWLTAVGRRVESVTSRCRASNGRM